MNPFPSNCRPYIDVMEELCPELLYQYLQLVGILHWDIELGRIVIFIETLLMPQYQAYHLIGHIEIIYIIFAYLKTHMKMERIVSDLMGPNVDLSVFNNNSDWTELYGGI